MTEATKGFRNNGAKVHNSSTHILKGKLDKIDTGELANIIGRDIYKVHDENERMLQEVRAPYETYQKKIRLTCRGIGIILLVFMLLTLVMTIGSDFMDFIHVDIFQRIVVSKIKTSGGFTTLVWYAAYGLPYTIVIDGFIHLYERTREKFEVFL